MGRPIPEEGAAEEEEEEGEEDEEEECAMERARLPPVTDACCAQV